MSYIFTQAECLEWAKNPNVNPKTSRKIDPRAQNGVYQQLLKQCSQLRAITITTSPAPGGAEGSRGSSPPETQKASSVPKPPSVEKTKAVSAEKTKAVSAEKTPSTEKTKAVSAEKTASVEKTKESTKESPSVKEKYTAAKKLPVAKTPNRLWPNLSRDEVIALAGRVLAEDPVAQAQAIELQKIYESSKDAQNDLYDEWQKSAALNADQELELASDFLGRFCRCLQEFKLKNNNKLLELEESMNKASGTETKKKIQQQINALTSKSFAVCQSTIYNSRGQKGVATRGSDKITCDDDLAVAENVIKKVKRTSKK